MNDGTKGVAELKTMAGDEAGSEWRVVAALDEIDAGQMIAREIGALQLALYNVGGNIFVTDNVCTHAYALLTDGWLDDSVVECPLHGGQFDVCTGKAMCTPAEVDLRTYPVRIVDGQVEVLLPA
jgi:nitrite reductase/ring-hydroxylating ferredoxin subunit